jgi:hypothetical protein
MNACRRYIPALGFEFLTPLYDPLVATTSTIALNRIVKRS